MFVFILTFKCWFENHLLKATFLDLFKTVPYLTVSFLLDPLFYLIFPQSTHIAILHLFCLLPASLRTLGFSPLRDPVVPAPLGSAGTWGCCPAAWGGRGGRATSQPGLGLLSHLSGAVLPEGSGVGDPGPGCPPEYDPGVEAEVPLALGSVDRAERLPPPPPALLRALGPAACRGPKSHSSSVLP